MPAELPARDIPHEYVRAARAEGLPLEDLAVDEAGPTGLDMTANHLGDDSLRGQASGRVRAATCRSFPQ